MESHQMGRCSATNAHKDDAPNLDEYRRSSLFGSSELSFEDTIQVDKDKLGNSCIEHMQSTDVSQEPKSPGSNIGSTPEASPDSALKLQSPPVQVMERSLDNSAYRIPSYVFARNKSNTPMEWSVASNESLFSIHTSNVSLTKDQFNWLLKSGEFNAYGDLGNIRKSGELTPPLPPDPRKSGELIPPLAMDIRKSREQIKAANFKPSSVNPTPGNQAIDVVVLNPAQADDIVNADLPARTDKDESNGQVKEERKANPSLSDEALPLSPSVSNHSDTSCQSFAFPKLSAEMERNKSVNSGSQREKSSARDELKVEPPKTPVKANTEATPHGSSCFACFGCCSCC